MNPAYAIPAATVVIFRERRDGPPDLLMVQRSTALAFAGGAWVFPGGRVDPGDRELAITASATDVDEAAARIAAIRETLEETGIAIGIDPAPDAALVAALRQRLHAGTAFAVLLAEAGLVLRPDCLLPFARWRPAHAVSRVFDTRFYLASLPADATEAAVDGTENIRLAWSSAAAMLARAAAGDAPMIFPTRRNLERLARFASFADAVADSRAHPVETITPWVERRDGADHVCIPPGLGYPVTAEPLSAADRG